MGFGVWGYVDASVGDSVLDTADSVPNTADGVSDTDDGVPDTADAVLDTTDNVSDKMRAGEVAVPHPKSCFG